MHGNHLEDILVHGRPERGYGKHDSESLATCLLRHSKARDLRLSAPDRRSRPRPVRWHHVDLTLSDPSRKRLPPLGTKINGCPALSAFPRRAASSVAHAIGRQHPLRAQPEMQGICSESLAALASPIGSSSTTSPLQSCPMSFPSTHLSAPVRCCIPATLHRASSLPVAASGRPARQAHPPCRTTLNQSQRAAALGGSRSTGIYPLGIAHLAPVQDGWPSYPMSLPCPWTWTRAWAIDSVGCEDRPPFVSNGKPRRMTAGQDTCNVILPGSICADGLGLSRDVALLLSQPPTFSCLHLVVE